MLESKLPPSMRALPGFIADLIIALITRPVTKCNKLLAHLAKEENRQPLMAAEPSGAVVIHSFIELYP